MTQASLDVAQRKRPAMRPDVTSPAPRAVSVPGVELLDERLDKWNRRSILVLTILPLAGLLAAIVSMWGWGITPVDFGIFLFFYVATGLGITVGYHRLFTHQSFKAARPVKIALAVAGSMAIEGAVIDWVSAHRRHHAFSDKEGDPHSPHLDHDGTVKGILRGLWHAHVGWLFAPEKTSAERWAPDLLKDSAIVKIDRLFPWWIAGTFMLPALAGFAITGTLRGAITALLWGGLARVFLLHHVTWSINSICHYYGKRPFETTDKSTNNWPLAVLSFGESWHNNHHAFPTSAVHGILKGQFDMSGFVIRGFERLGLARDVKLVSDKQLQNKRA